MFLPLPFSKSSFANHLPLPFKGVVCFYFPSTSNYSYHVFSLSLKYTQRDKLLGQLFFFLVGVILPMRKHACVFVFVYVLF